MKKSTIISAASILAFSALTPAVSIAAENDNAGSVAPGFYNIKTGKVILASSFIFIEAVEKLQVLLGENYYFVDGEGNALKATYLVHAKTNSEIEEQMELETDIEERFKVELTPDGKVVFLTVKGYSDALEEVIKEANEKLDKIADENKQAVKDAIQAAEDALNDANATIQDLQKALEALEQLEDVLKNASADVQNPEIKEAQDAVKLAQQLIQFHNKTRLLIINRLEVSFLRLYYLIEV